MAVDRCTMCTSFASAVRISQSLCAFFPFSTSSTACVGGGGSWVYGLMGGLWVMSVLVALPTRSPALGFVLLSLLSPLLSLLFFLSSSLSLLYQTRFVFFSCLADFPPPPLPDDTPKYRPSCLLPSCGRLFATTTSTAMSTAVMAVFSQRRPATSSRSTAPGFPASATTRCCCASPPHCLLFNPLWL